MRVSEQKFNKNLKNQLLNTLCQALADIRKPEEIRMVLKDLLSGSAIDIVIKKFGAAYLLQKGKTYGEVKKSLALSSATVASIAKELEKGRGLQIVLKNVLAEEWALKWTNKIGKLMGKKRW
jgi:uncharacterized protein YerC